MKEIQKEIIPISKEDLFIVLNHPNANFDYSVHYHPEYEINLVMNTSGERIVGDSIQEYKNLDLVMIGPNLPHAWKGNIIEGNHVITVQFSEELLNLPILQKRIFSQIKKLLSDSQKGITFSSKTQNSVKDKFIALTKMKGFQTVIEFFSILHELSISDYFRLASNNYDIYDIIRDSKSRRITKACDFIKANLHEQIRLGEIANLVNMSESAFSHFFKKKTNTTVIEYITNLRITKACELLTQTSDSIAEICFQCGYNNQSNFIKTFKKKKGCTPSDYRTFMEQMLLKY